MVVMEAIPFPIFFGEETLRTPIRMEMDACAIGVAHTLTGERERERETEGSGQTNSTRALQVLLGKYL